MTDQADLQALSDAATLGMALHAAYCVENRPMHSHPNHSAEAILAHVRETVTLAASPSPDTDREDLRERVFSIMHDESCDEGEPHSWTDHLPWDEPDDEAASNRLADRLIAGLRPSPDTDAGLDGVIAERDALADDEQACHEDYERLADLAKDAVLGAAQVGMYFPALEQMLGMEDGLTRRIAELHRGAVDALGQQLGYRPGGRDDRLDALQGRR